MRICQRCVMDDRSDATIRFDSNGFCNYCSDALNKIGKVYFPNEEGKKRLAKIICEIKEHGKGKKFDCIMGISGGLDSSYLLYLGYQWGLRIMAVHVDDGYDTDISRRNLKKLIHATGIKVKIIKPDAEQFNALTKAYMRAGVANLAAPQDNILFAYLYDFAKRNHIKYFLSGGNFALESILQKGNTHNAMDLVNIKDIHKKFGDRPINKLKFISNFGVLFDRKIAGLKVVCLLDDIDYNRDRAFAELKAFCGFEYYGAKHLENKLTAFIQLVWFVEKFHVDKRRSHLSSMIVSGQMTREKALIELERPLYDKEMMDEYVGLIKRKLGLSDAEFDRLMAAPVHDHKEYKTDRLFDCLAGLKTLLGKACHG